jgi:hypothetical protein
MGALIAVEPTTAPRDEAQVRVVLVGALLLTERFAQSVPDNALRIVCSCPDPARAAAALADVVADVIVIELPTLRESDRELLASLKAACRASSSIVLYRFAPSTVIRHLRAAGHAVVRATSDAMEIEAICLGLLNRPRVWVNPVTGARDGAEPPTPRFDEPTLVELSNASRVVECECPRHLVDLVMSLTAFERYSAECASRNPSDVALHLELQRAAGFARSIIEHALERTATAEGFALPPRPLSRERAV